MGPRSAAVQIRLGYRHQLLLASRSKRAFVGRRALKRPDELWKLPSVILEDGNATKFRQGQFLFLNDALKDDQIPEDWQSLGWVYSREGTLLGLGVIENEGGVPYLKVSVSLVES